MAPPSLILLIISIAFAFANIAQAQSVRVQNGLGEWGYGWMFRHAGNCYAALPEHVAGPLPKVTVATAAPVVSDQAIVQKPFWPGVDLAVAIIDQGPLDSRCTQSLDDLKPSAVTRSTQRAFLHRITPVGEEELLPLEIVERGYLTFSGQLAQDGAAISQGTSGAFAFVAEKPIGMALTSGDSSRATFMRGEEIRLNLARYLGEQGSAFTAQPAAAQQASATTGLKVREWSANIQPVLPQQGPENLDGEGLWIVQPNGAVELTMRLDGSAPSGISRVQISAPGDGKYAIPQKILVFFDPSEAGRNFRFWTQGEMRPDGVFDTGPLASRSARWVRITITSARTPGPIALDRVVVR